MKRYNKRRGLTAAQQAAHEKSYDQCDHTVEGRFSKGDYVSDYFGRECWKVVTYGIRYHEDVSTRIYGVQPCAGPKGWKQCVEIRAAIGRVLADGTPEPGSRCGRPHQSHRPAGAKIVSWTDRRHNSQASCPTITVYAGSIVGVCSPNYDDSPTVAWLSDGKLAARLAKLIEQCPQPVTLPHADVKERTTKLTIDESHPRFAAFMAARDAVFTPAHESAMGWKHQAELKLPRAEWRRIRSELDAAAATTSPTSVDGPSEESTDAR